MAISNLGLLHRPTIQGRAYDSVYAVKASPNKYSELKLLRGEAVSMMSEYNSL